MDKLQRDGILQPTHNESLKKCKSCISGKMTRKPFPHQAERAKDLLGLIHTDVALLELCQKRVLVTSSPLQMILAVMGCETLVKPNETIGYYFYYLLKNKIFIAQNAELFENNLMVQEASKSHGLLEASESDGGLELIQEYNTQPSENTSEIHDEVVPTEVEPQSFGVPIRRSARIPQAFDIYGFYVDVEEYELGDLNEPPNYKAT
ncbi:hypothetical protein Tco_0956798 [Tanacetum coccineum]